MSHFSAVHSCHMASTEQALRINNFPSVKRSCGFDVGATVNAVASCERVEFQPGVNEPINLDGESP